MGDLVFVFKTEVGQSLLHHQYSFRSKKNQQIPVKYQHLSVFVDQRSA